MKLFKRKRRVLPGFGLSLGVTLLFVSLVTLLPISALLIKTAMVDPAVLWKSISSPRAVASYRLTLGAAAAAASFNAFFGLLLAWILVRYRFPGRRLLDAMMDLPFALPTSVAGIALTAVFANSGFFGSLLEPLGIQVAYTRLGVVVAMIFTSLPFVVRTVQPVLEDLDEAVEEAAASLGAGFFQILRRVTFPLLLPSLLTGASLAFVRCLGEFGAIIFISGNLAFKTEITALIIFIRLEEFDYDGAAAVATVVLLFSLSLLFVINSFQQWKQRYAGGAD